MRIVVAMTGATGAYGIHLLAALAELGVERHLILSRVGAIVAQPVPAFYSSPQTIDDLIDHSVARVFDCSGWRCRSCGAGLACASIANTLPLSSHCLPPTGADNDRGRARLYASECRR